MTMNLSIDTCWLAIGLCAGLAQPLCAAQADAAANYPSKPIRFIAPFVAGAGTDTTARSIAAKLTEA
jgi:tripartite-type tricarboxylate transporter receptor subunit TctC